MSPFIPLHVPMKPFFIYIFTFPLLCTRHKRRSSSLYSLCLRAALIFFRCLSYNLLLARDQPHAHLTIAIIIASIIKPNRLLSPLATYSHNNNLRQMVLHLSVFSSLNVVFRIGRAYSRAGIALCSEFSTNSVRDSFLTTKIQRCYTLVLYTFRHSTSWSHFIEPSRPMNIAKTIRPVSTAMPYHIVRSLYNLCVHKSTENRELN